MDLTNCEDTIPGKDQLFQIDVDSGIVSKSYLSLLEIRGTSFDTSYNMEVLSHDNNHFITTFNVSQ